MTPNEYATVAAINNTPTMIAVFLHLSIPAPVLNLVTGCIYVFLNLYRWKDILISIIMQVSLPINRNLNFLYRAKKPSYCFSNIWYVSISPYETNPIL